MTATAERATFEITFTAPPTFWRTTPDGRLAAFWVPPTPVKPVRRRTAAADRTRSARWRAGTRRNRRLTARRRPARDPWAGWTDLGWIDETNGVEA